MATDKKKVSQYLALTKSFAQIEFTISQRSDYLHALFSVIARRCTRAISHMCTPVQTNVLTANRGQ